jgi:DNA-directed RNA polymerase specialized sigma24 family protein
VNDPELWELLQAVAASPDAWPRLATELDPVLVMMAKNQPIGRLKDRDDTPREIVTRVLARLHKREFEAIKRLCAMAPRPELRAWLRVLVKRSAIDYMRESPEYERGNANRDHRWISLATLSSLAVAPNPDTLAEKRTQVTSFLRDAVAEGGRALRELGNDDAISQLSMTWKIDRTHARRLIARGEQYIQVLGAILDGHSYPETATRLGITRREVELTVRYIEDFLEARGFAKAPS